MADPVSFSIAAIGGLALKEGITFLYGQAGDILKEWRKRRQDLTSKKHNENKPIVLPDIFEGQLGSTSIDYEVVAEIEPRIRALYRDLSEYAADLAPIDCSDLRLLRNVDELRQCLEAILHQNITFKGEERPRSGTIVVGHVAAETIAGEAIGLEANDQAFGEFRGKVDAKKIEQGAKAVGVKWQGSK